MATAPDSPLVRFWDQAFAGPTPFTALSLALREGLIPQELLAAHAQRWYVSWIEQLDERCYSGHFPGHCPWRTPGPSEMPPRLARIDQPPAVHTMPDAQWMEVVQAFGDIGVDLLAPLPGRSGIPDGTTLDLAVSLNWPSLVDLLVSLPTSPGPAALDARRTGGPVLGERVALPWLHAAALNGSDSLLEALLDAGLDPDAPDHRGQSALYHARTPRAVKALLGAGANPIHPDADGRTPLQHFEQLRASGTVVGYRIDPVIQALGETGASPAQAQAATVLYVARPPTEIKQVDAWHKNLPDPGVPLHQARMNPGGMWKGEWSPAAWLGLQLLSGGCGMPHQLPGLLARPDFLSPADACPRPRSSISEWGLLGLAMADRIGHLPLPSVPDDATPFSHGDVSKATQWRIRNALQEKWGTHWFDAQPWAAAMATTSRSLLDARATSGTVRQAIARAQVSQLRLRGWKTPDDLARFLEQARVSSHARFDENSWFDILTQVPPAQRATFALLRLGDALETCRRKAASSQPLLNSGVSNALFAMEIAMSGAGANPVLPGPGQPLHEEVVAILGGIEKLDIPKLARVCAPLRQCYLDAQLPSASSRSSRPARM